MAYSTQKDFFHVPFMNEDIDTNCKRACVKLKSYDSSIDYRSWARDESKKSEYLRDLVTCKEPVTGMGPEEEANRTIGLAGIVDSSSNNVPIIGKSKLNVADNISSTRSATIKDKSSAFIDGEFSMSEVDNLLVGDSLLQCANLHLTDYQKMMNIKVSLEKELEISNERLHIASKENKKIKDILLSKYDSNISKDFHNKVQKLIATRKLDKNEENEMLKIFHKMEDVHKAYEVRQAENTYLRRLIDKLSKRVTIDQIKTEVETSTDVKYLQQEVNSLRRECKMLRAIEDNYLKHKSEVDKRVVTDHEADTIEAITKERNALRQKCKSLKSLEKNVAELENKYQESDRSKSNLLSDLNRQASAIQEMECDIQNMQHFYEKQLQDACHREQCLKAQLEDLKDNLIGYKCKLQKAEMLQREVACLKNEISKRDMAIRDYDCQHKHLMDVVEELKAIKLQNVQDNNTQTCNDEIDDLTFFTCATLEEIMKELKKRDCLLKKEKTENQNEYDSEYYAYGLEPGPRDVDLHSQENDMEAMKIESNSIDQTCTDALKRLKELQEENDKLHKQNASLQEENANLYNENGKLHKENETLQEENANVYRENTNMKDLLKEGEEQMTNMLKKIEDLDEELNKKADELKRSTFEMNKTKQLVESISSIQTENHLLANAVDAINTRDDEKIIDDLRRQLDEEMAKLQKCQLENAGLFEQLQDRNEELKQLKDLNNNLQKNIERIENEKQKLIDENHSLRKDYENLRKEQTKEELGKGIIKENNKETLKTENKIINERKKSTDKKDNIKDVDNEDIGKQNFVENINDNASKSIKRVSTPPLEDVKSLQRLNSVATIEDTKSLQTLNSLATIEDTKSLQTLNSLPTVDSKPFETAILPPLSKPFENLDSILAVDSKLVEKVKRRPSMDEKRNKKQTAALEAFIQRSAENLKFNFNQGSGFEKELRKIFDEFIQECNFCFSRQTTSNVKNKLHAICHRLYSGGLTNMPFRELAYLHKKVFGQAEKLVPGCLLTMIIKDYMEEILVILNETKMSGDILVGSSEMDDSMLQKCCFCKTELCCNKSEERLKEQVSKLEKDIGIVRDCLILLKTSNSQTKFVGLSECDGAVSPTEIINSKQPKKMRKQLKKNTEIY